MAVYYKTWLTPKADGINNNLICELPDRHSCGGFVCYKGDNGIRKYLILTTILALCACNNGGGHGGGDANYNIANSSGISGSAGTTNPDGSQSNNGTNDTEKPGNTEQKPNDNITYPNVPDSKQLTIQSMGTFSTTNNKTYRLGGIFDKENGELRIQRLRPYKYAYTSTCQEEDGCDLSYRYGEEYYKWVIWDSGSQSWLLRECKSLEGCTSHANKDQEIIVICRNPAGCLLENNAEPEIIFDVKNSDDGIFVTEFTDSNNSSDKAEFTLGSKNLNVPLRYSDFGYWGRTITKDNDDGTVYAIKGWIAGDAARAVDMNALAEVGEITGEHTYSGKAFVGISTGKTDRFVPHPELGDDLPGFTANGTAKLSFNADNGTENLVMDFTDAGWYKVYTKDDELIYVGNPTTDPKFKVESAKSNYTKDTKYYGPDAFMPATEVVGTVDATDIKMQDGFYRDIGFSFGAVKD